jgi:uncharacterized protein YjbJ (UPF0337 family)
MNWDQIAGRWAQVKGEARRKWGKLTDDDMEVIAGSKDKFVGRVQERYGIAKEEAQKQIDDWFNSLPPTDPRAEQKTDEQRRAKGA